eukprot:Em0004g1384a
MTELCFAVTHAEVFKKEAACGSDLLRHQFSCLQGYGGSEPLRQQFSSQACGVQRQLSSPGSFQCGRTPMGSQVDSGWEHVDDTELANEDKHEQLIDDRIQFLSRRKVEKLRSQVQLVIVTADNYGWYQV